MTTINSKYYFSTEALTAAYVNANLSIDIINQNLNLQESEVDIKYCSFNINSIVNSVIFLEATINEFYSEVSDAKENSLIINTLEQLPINRFKKFLNIDRSFLKTSSILDKYRLALVLLDKEDLKTGEEPYQSTQLLIELRNYLVHYKIETINLLQEEASSLQKKLRGKFSLHPLIADSGQRIYYPFPKDHLSHDSAKWAINTCQNFTKIFFELINYKPFIEPNVKKYWKFK